MGIEQINEDFKPCYTWPNKYFPFRVYFKHPKLKIIIIDSIVHNYNWLNEYRDKISNKYFFFVTLCWNHTEFLWQQTLEIFNNLNLNKKNFYFMCNTHKELFFLHKFGFSGDLINKNAWIDEKLYTPQFLEKKYNAILIGRRVKWKRHYLASQVSKLALVSGGVNVDLEETEDILLPAHIYNNYKILKPQEIALKINQSNVGLCLSKEEGACASSSEYLLCGVPVVSTKSEGGRDFWYDDYNSIVCEDNIQSVTQAVNYFLSNKRDPEIIRSNHVNLAVSQRIKFIKKLQDIFSEKELRIDAANYYEKKYLNKLITSICPSFEKIFN